MAKKHYPFEGRSPDAEGEPYKLTYALSVGLVPEPELRISNKTDLPGRGHRATGGALRSEMNGKGGKLHDGRETRGAYSVCALGRQATNPESERRGVAWTGRVLAAVIVALPATVSTWQRPPPSLSSGATCSIRFRIG